MSNTQGKERLDNLYWNVIIFRMRDELLDICKLEILFGSTIGSYNLGHRLFALKYATAEQQVALANEITVRLNVPNFLTLELGNLISDFSHLHHCKSFLFRLSV